MMKLLTYIELMMALTQKGPELVAKMIKIHEELAHLATVFLMLEMKVLDPLNHEPIARKIQ